MKHVRSIAVALSLFLIFVDAVLAQGEDSTRYERDAQVISTLLPGLYDNYNQVYFDGRTGVSADKVHPRREIQVVLESGGRQEPRNVFQVTDTIVTNLDRYGNTTGSRETQVRRYAYVVSANNQEQGTQMDVYPLSESGFSDDVTQGNPVCSVLFVREASQFSSAPLSGCDDMPAFYTLSEKQLFIGRWPTHSDAPGAEIPFQLNRARTFECYVDIPGVSGGRDEPYERYEGFEVHDQGGSIEFTTRDESQRTFILTLANIDWPINNHHDVFTRDVLVFYLSERTKDGVKNLGYSFTEPTVKRMGINFKWLLMSCWMESNKVTKPFM